MKYIAFLLIPLALATTATGQQRVVTIPEAVDAALANNPATQAASLYTSQQEALKKASVTIPKTDIVWLHGQYNSINKNDNNFTISQSIPFPTVFGKQHKLAESSERLARLEETMTKNEIAYQVRKTANTILYLKAQRNVLVAQDSFMTRLTQSVAIRYQAGDATLLEKTSYETQSMQLKNQLMRNEQNKQVALNNLRALCQLPSLEDVGGDLRKDFVYADNTNSSTTNPQVQYAFGKAESAQYERQVESSKIMPDIHVGYFNQSLIGFQTVNGGEQYFDASKRFQGFQLGLSVPLWFSTQSAKVKAAGIHEDVMKKNAEYVELQFNQRYQEAHSNLRKNEESIRYFESAALKSAELLVEQSKKAYKNGEIDYPTLLLNMRQALTIQDDYLDAVYARNENIITLQFLNGQ